MINNGLNPSFTLQSKLVLTDLGRQGWMALDSWQHRAGAN
jgi:hypothetical protein